MVPEIFYEDESFIIVSKPHGLPSAPLSSSDSQNAFSLVAKDFPEILNISGKKTIEGGLVHRIDTDTQGLILIARTQTAYDNFIQQQKNSTFIKTYTAICVLNNDIEVLKLPYIITSQFRPFGEGRKMVKPVFEDSGRAAIKKSSSKAYSTEIYAIEKQSEYFTVKCKITEGYRHQVRSHLSYLGLKIVNDTLYGTTIDNSPMQFFATGLEFFHPVSGKKIIINL